LINWAESVERKKRIFSLVELLVVIAILAVLMSLLIPSMKRVVYLSSKTKCKNNIRQLVTGLLIYAADYNDHYPRSESGWRNGGGGYEGENSLSILRGTGAPNMEVRPLIRPYWGWSEGGPMMTEWGWKFPDTTEIEKCPVRKDPHNELYSKTINASERVGNYFYYFSVNGKSIMERVGDLHAPSDPNSRFDRMGVDVLVSDIFLDRKDRIANHHEMSSLFSESQTGSGFTNYTLYAWKTKTLRPPITGNFAGQDGSVGEHWLPPGLPGVWMGFDGFESWSHSLWVPDQHWVDY
jgi:type II secretory pathway pseudopilin PulG